MTLTSPGSGSTTSETKPPFSGEAGTAPGDSSAVIVKIFSGRGTAGSPVETRTAIVSGGSWSAAPTHALPNGTYTAQDEQADNAGVTGVSDPSTFTIDSTAAADDSTLPANASGVGAGSDPGTAPGAYSVGGTVSGLSGTVVLRNNGGDRLSVSSNAAFTFVQSMAKGAAYDVTVEASPTGQTCSVSGAAGTVASANVTSVVVTCSTTTTTPPNSAVGQDDFDRADGALGAGWAAMSDGGLSIASQAVIGTAGTLAGDIRTAENYDSDQYSSIAVTSASLPVSDWVGPTVRSQNGGQDMYLGLYWNDQNTGSYVLQLYVRNASGWSQLGDTYTLGGPLPAGTQLALSAVGSTLSFQEDGIERITATHTSLTGGAPGLMTFGTATADSWAGGNADAPSSSPPSAYSIGGSVSGLSGTVVLQDNGGDDLSLSSDGGFTFSTPIAGGAAYNVTVKTNPSGETCATAAAAGTIGSADVTDVAVTCSTSTLAPPPPPPMQVHYRGTDADGIASYSVTSADNGYGTQVLRVLTPTHPAPGVPHNFLYVLPVEAGLGTVYGDGIETLRSLDAQDEYNLTIVEPTFSVGAWIANNPTDPNLQYETFYTQDLVPWVTQHLAVTGNEQNWLIGFSRSGLGAQDLLSKHPDTFAVAASWDFPGPDMSSYDLYAAGPNYGTDANFQANYRLTPTFVATHSLPFLTNNRIWIGGYNAFQTDVADYDALLNTDGILHTTEAPQQMVHRWDSGWVPLALSALSQDSAALSG